MTDEVAERVESACGRPMEALLRAERDELDGSGTTELAGHIRACERCGALARSILAGYETLNDALEPGVELNAPRIVALGRARAGVRRRSTWRWPMPPAWAAATAAAAAIAAALALVLPAPRGPQLEPVWQPPATVASAPVVSAPHHNVAVIQTDDPDITVFWFYKE